MFTALLGTNAALQPLTQIHPGKNGAESLLHGGNGSRPWWAPGVLRREPAGGMQLVAPVTSGALAALQLPSTVQGVLAAASTGCRPT